MDVRFCPYCGSPRVDTTSHAECNGVESVIASCLGCGEECLVDRNVANDYDDDEDEDPSNSR
jgi:hypothetical protein